MAVTTSGTPEKLTKKLISTGIAFVEGGQGVKDTITDTGSDFLNAGFLPGDSITVSGTVSNNGSYTIHAVVAGTITLNSQDDLTAESAGSSFKIVAPVSVPDGVGLRIKARAGNSGNIIVGHSSATALNTGTPLAGWALDSSESVELQVSSSDVVWLDTTNSGDIVEVILETNATA